MCHFWRNLPFIEECAIYGEECAIFEVMCHFWRNVPFGMNPKSLKIILFCIGGKATSEELLIYRSCNSSLATFSNLTKGPYGKPAAFCSLVFLSESPAREEEKNPFSFYVLALTTITQSVAYKKPSHSHICQIRYPPRVSVQGVKSLGSHLACLCRGFDFYEVRK